MNCPNCGREIQDDAKFCMICGEKLPEIYQENSEQEYSVQSEKEPKKNHRKKLMIIGCILAAVICVCVAIVFVPKLLSGLLSKNSYMDSVITYSNGDTVYRPREENLAYDEDESIIYYDNLLIVYLTSDISADESSMLAKQVDGVVVGDISGIVNMLQIMVDSCDINQLNTYADTLMESNYVMYATYDIPLCLSDTADDNPWSENGTTISGKGEVDNPDGNDWWAEAIDAYSAWEYVDSHSDAISDITVGILDSGFDTEHAELSDHISVVNENSAADHGTHVAGIVAAANNTEGIRGIADTANLVCADWEQETTDENGNITTENLLDTGEWTELTKQLIEQGAKVINNSWGQVVYSEEGLAKELCKITDDSTDIFVKMMRQAYPWTFPEYSEDKIDDTLIANTVNNMQKLGVYDKYQIYVEKESRQSGYSCLAMIVSLLQNDANDILFVQSAGNGYDNGRLGIESHLAGFYAAVTEDLYQGVSEKEKSKLGLDGYTYEMLKEHILIVGAVENDTKDGNYKMTYFSNYGDSSSSKVDICAPGDGIFSTLTLADDTSNTKNQGKVYGELSGTSMAAPMVAGAAALVWSVNPDLSAAEVKEILCTNISTYAVGVGDDEGNTYPMLNVGLSVQAAAPVTISNITFDVDCMDKYDDTYEMELTYQYATIKAYDENNELVWEYRTSDCIAAELDSVYEIGRKGNGYYFVEGGTVVALNVATGSVLWENSDFGGSGCSVLGDDAIYMCGYYGPDFFAVSYTGETLWKIDSFDDAYWWAYKIELKDNEALVYMSGGDDGTSLPVIFCVNLETGEYAIYDSTETGTMTATRVTYEINTDYEDDTTIRCSVTITGVNDNGEQCWTIQTDSYELLARTDMELSFEELGTDNDSYYYYDGGYIIAVNIADGSQIFKTKHLLSGIVDTAFNGSGTVFIACETIISDTYYINGVEYKFPHFMAVDVDGKIIAEIVFSDRDCTIDDMQYDNGKVTISVESTMGSKIVIDTSDYSYEVY